MQMSQIVWKDLGSVQKTNIKEKSQDFRRGNQNKKIIIKTQIGTEFFLTLNVYLSNHL